MANKTLKARLISNNATAAQWASSNPIPLKGELCLENDTRKFKFGDGTRNFNSLEYASAKMAEVKNTAPTASNYQYDAGQVWIDASANPQQAYILLSNTGNVATWVRVITSSGSGITADTALRLSTPHTIAGHSFDGTQDITITAGDVGAVAKNNAITGGTHTKITYDSKGLVTGGTDLTASDIPDLSGTYVKTDKVGAANGVASLDASGKIPSSQLLDYLLGQVLYGGTLGANAVATLSSAAKSKLQLNTNTQTLTDNGNSNSGYSGNEGIYYIVNVAQTFAGISFEVGDWCISNGNAWTKIDNTDAVVSVVGLSGTITKSALLAALNVQDGAEVNPSIASQSEATTGTNNTKMMTPLSTKQAIAGSTIDVQKLNVASGDTLIIDGSN